MNQTKFNSTGYFLAPLISSFAYLITAPIWFFIEFGFDRNMALRLGWHIVFVTSTLAPLTILFITPALYFLRGFAKYVVLPKNVFLALCIALSFIFSGLVCIYMREFASSYFFAALFCGLALSFVIFGQSFRKALTIHSSGTPNGAP
jgi:predicted lysophospholipase L1 biosynthesis ABC-type transport system permease subunit